MWTVPEFASKGHLNLVPVKLYPLPYSGLANVSLERLSRKYTSDSRQRNGQVHMCLHLHI